MQLDYGKFSEYQICDNNLTTSSVFFNPWLGLLVSGNNDAKSDGDEIKIDATLKAGAGTDPETLQKEEEAINIDGLNTKEVKQLRDKVSDSGWNSQPIFIHENPLDASPNWAT